MKTIKQKLTGFFPVLAAGLAGAFGLVSCADTPYGDEPVPGGNIVLTISLEQQSKEVMARSTVAPLPEEETLESLSLLFFEYTEDGSGKCLNSYTLTENLRMNQERPINLAQAQGLNNSSSYSILAIANLADDRYISEGRFDWLENQRGLTENEVMQSAVATLSSGQRITPGEILMTGRTRKLADQQRLELVLKRVVARYDVHNLQREKYDLVSVTISNAANKTGMWSGGAKPAIGHLQQLYRLMAENDGSGRKKDMVGGLYSFENFTVSPKPDDQVTTCLVIGLAPRGGSPFDGWNAGETRYYRVNIHPVESSQNILRNNAYKINIRNVIGEGAPTELAARQTDGEKLDYIINNWDYDDNGVILFDGLNTLVFPVKTVMLDPAGETREYPVFTLGPGKLVVQNYEMDNGITAVLEGNTLKVTADPLGSETERTGSVDLTIGSLRATIYFIQKPDVKHFLRINKTKTASFSGTGTSCMMDGNIEVSSSGPWKAKIFNNDQFTTNPGFSFSSSDPQVYEFSQAANNGSNSFQIFTTGSNPSETAARNSFVLVWLEEDENLNAALVLLQKTSSNFSVTPSLPNNTIVFSPVGVPLTPRSPGSAAGDFVHFTVLSGEGPTPGSVNAWDVSLTGPHAEYFELVKHIHPDDNTAGANYFEVRARGTQGGSCSNYLGQTLTATVKAYLDIPNSDKFVTMSISQDPVTFEVNEAGNDHIAARGGVVNNGIGLYIDCALPADSYSWSATIRSQTHESSHAVYFIDGNGQRQTSLSGVPLSENLKVGFDKILYPMVYEEASAVIEVTLDGTGLKDDVTITQNPLVQRDFWMQNFRDGWGYIRVNGASPPTGLDHDLFNAWVYYLWDSSTSDFTQHRFFGPNGIVNVRSKNFYRPFFMEEDRSGIWEKITWLHSPRADYNEVRHWTTIDEWLAKNDGNWLVLCNDETVDNTYTRYLNAKGYTRGSLGSNLSVNSKAKATKIMRYLLKDGPFTYGNELPTSGYTFTKDGWRNAVATWPEQAVAVVTEDGDDANAQVLIDFKHRIFYIGEVQIGNDGHYANDLYNEVINKRNTQTADMYRSKFNANLVAFLINATMYGTHFTDLFLEDDWDPIK